MSFLSSADLFRDPLRQPSCAFLGERPLRFRELRSAVQAVCATAARSPIERWLVNCKDAGVFAASFFGVLHAGKTVVLPPFSVVGEQERELLDCQGTFSDVGMGGFDEIHHPLRLEAAHVALSSLPLDKPCIELFTSGSTGRPKAVQKTLGNLDCEVRGLEALWGGMLDGARFVASVGPQHIYGLLFRVLWPLCSSRSVAGPTVLYPEEMVPWLSDEPSVLIGSPALFKRLIDFDGLGALLSSCRLAISSGGALPEAVFDALLARGVGVREVFGSTETGGVAWRKTPREAWTLFPGVDGRQSDDGKLQVRSPFIQLPAGEWFEMQDAVSFIDAKHFRHAGRTDRVVKIEEKRVSLDDVERRLLQSGLLKDACVLPVVRTRRLRLGAAVVPNAPAAAPTDLLKRLKDLCAGQLDPVLVPRYFRVLRAIPVNAQGKRQLALLERLFDSTMPAVTNIVYAAGGVTLELDVPDDLVFLPGHFPGHPIVPGFVQLSWAAYYAEAYGGVERIAGARAVKFPSQLLPLSRASLRLRLNGVESVAFEISSSGRPVSSGQLVVARR